MSRPAPYPADTRAKGWRFELDYEQLDQSDTWPLAAEVPMCQHALLMMWLVAWGQTPCGSFPNDEAVIRAKCKVPAATWSKCRDVLMRGWWLADDGRLYHNTLAKRVEEMMKRRRSDSDRQAERRKREAADAAAATLSESGGNHGGVTDVSRVTPHRVTPESSTDNRLPTTEEVSKPSVSHPVAKARGEGRFPEFWTAWPNTTRKADRKKCLAKWQRLGCDGEAEAILSHVASLKATRQWVDGFEPAPLTYLNGERWHDGVDVRSEATADALFDGVH